MGSGQAPTASRRPRFQRLGCPYRTKETRRSAMDLPIRRPSPRPACRRHFCPLVAWHRPRWRSLRGHRSSRGPPRRSPCPPETHSYRPKATSFLKENGLLRSGTTSLSGCRFTKHMSEARGARPRPCLQVRKGSIRLSKHSRQGQYPCLLWKSYRKLASRWPKSNSPWLLWRRRRTETIFPRWSAIPAPSDGGCGAAELTRESGRAVRRLATGCQ